MQSGDAAELILAVWRRPCRGQMHAQGANATEQVAKGSPKKASLTLDACRAFHRVLAGRPLGQK